MLILARTNGQQIMIGDDVIITVQDIREGRCKVAIAAHRDIPVHRREVYEVRHQGTPHEFKAQHGREAVCHFCGLGKNNHIHAQPEAPRAA